MGWPVGPALLLALAMPCVAWAGQGAMFGSAMFEPAMSSQTITQPSVSHLLSSGPAAPQPALSRSTTFRSIPPRPASARPAAASVRTSRAGGLQVLAADPSTLCETAVTTAEYVNRLPPRLLGAMSLTETGRVEAASGRVRPWPWTINAAGEGRFFDTPQDAVAAVKALQARGVRSIDVGCLQVSLMYHPEAFATLDEAFDPHANANYAARFLNALYGASNDWTAAIAAYHSETPALGFAYRVLVLARWQNGDPHPPVAGSGAYRDFAQAGAAYDSHAYGAFAPRSSVYGAFAPR